MRIDLNRLSKLAGLPTSSSTRQSLYEGKKHDKEEIEEMSEMEDLAFMDEVMYEEETEEGMHYEGKDEDEMEEMIEVDETMLVQELRRAKRIMQENKRRKQLSESRKRQRKQRMFETQLRNMIDQEVQSVFDEMNYTGGWVYGKNKPRRSRNGYTHQGSFMPGVGFRR